MTSPDPLANLERIGKLKSELPGRTEVEGLIHSGETRLADARRTELALESRFDLAYNAAHAIALAALRLRGYRSSNRYLVFQALEHTLDLPNAKWRILAKCHELRNEVEYQGAVAVQQTLLEDLIDVAAEILDTVRSLDLPNEAE